MEGSKRPKPSTKRVLGFCALFALIPLCCGNYPLLDVDTNMRIVLVPHDMPTNVPFYRLKATDSDHNFPLVFEVLGAVGKALLIIEFLGCLEAESLCQADVMLNKPLDPGRTYEFQLRVMDTSGDFTRVKAAITATDGSAFFQSMLGPKILRIPESTDIGTMLESFIVFKNEFNTRTVLLELREPGGRIELRQRLLSNNRTEGKLFLQKQLDFETEPWFTFRLLAMNAYTNVTVDTRNVLVSDVIVGVEDGQDTPPQFLAISNFVEIPGSINKGDLVTRVTAEDGDKLNKRLIRYGLLAESNPFVAFFDLDPMSGEIHLKRNISELLAMAKPNEPIRISVVAEEITPPSNRLDPPASQNSSMSIANITFWLGHSVAALRTSPLFSSQKYVGEIKENSLIGTLVKFSFETQVFILVPDEMIHLGFVGYSSNQHLCDGFEIVPHEGRGNFSFEIRVTDSSGLDYETLQIVRLKVRAISASGLSTTADMDIYIRDENDSKPQFTKKEYSAEIPEKSPAGTTVLQVHATDMDSGSGGEVSYRLIGSEAFHIDPHNGEITVDKPSLLDRELQPELRLYVEARDGGQSHDTSPSSDQHNVATSTVTIKLSDINDSPPIFESKTYQAVLTPDLDALKWPVQVRAVDHDAEGSPNSQVRYQVIGDNRFIVDSLSGDLRVRMPLRRPSRDTESPFLGTIKVKAYDLGSPSSLSSETTIQLFSEDVVSQEVQFVFPTNPDRINENRGKIEKMLESLTGGHVSILDVSSYDSSRHRALQQAPRSDVAQANARSSDADSERLGRSNNGQSLVTAKVNSPLSSKSRTFDLETLRAFMTDSGTVAPSPRDDPDVDVKTAESQTLFWLLIALILLLLLLFALFLCCIFCPCCYMYRTGSSRTKSEKVTNHTKDTIQEERNLGYHRSRRTVPATTDFGEYNSHTHSAVGGRQQAWSGDEMRRLPLQRRELNRKEKAQQTQQMRNDISLEDWEYGGQVQDLPLQYVRSDPRADDIGPRWQMMQQQQQRGTETTGRRHVTYEDGIRQTGDNKFTRRCAAEDQQEYLAPQRLPYGYNTGEIDNRSEQKMSRKQYVPHSPPHSLPPASTEYRQQHSDTKLPQTRFYRTEMGEVLQFDFDGDEGKEMIMRRYIDEQEGETAENVRSHQQRKSHQKRGPDTNQPYQYTQQLVEDDQDDLPDPIPIAYHPHQQHHPEPPQAERPRAASISRRQTLGPIERDAKASRKAQIIEMEEDEDDSYLQMPGSVRQGHHATEEKVALESESHSRRKERHKDKEKDKEKRRSRDRIRSTESRKSQSKSKSKSKSPAPTTESAQSKPRRSKERHSHERRSVTPTTTVIPVPMPEVETRPYVNDLEQMNLNKSASLSPSRERPITISVLSNVDHSPHFKPEADHLQTSHTSHQLHSGRSSRQQGHSITEHEDKVKMVEEVTHLMTREEDDQDSGIGLVAVANRRSKMLEKKSVFTIAYDEMATQNVLRPDTAINNDIETS